MKLVEEIAGPLLVALDQWKRANKKIIVGIDGYSAAGKSTLLQYVQNQRDDVETIEMDSFLTPRGHRKDHKHLQGRLITDWRVNPFFVFEPMDKLLKQYRTSVEPVDVQLYSSKSGEWNARVKYDYSKPLLIIEGAMVLHSPAEGYLDKLVFLDTDYDAADKLRLRRIDEKLGAGASSNPKYLEWAKMYRSLYEQYENRYNPRERADLILQT